jgi:MFS superfamily sulfate permease-like transporter
MSISMLLLFFLSLPSLLCRTLFNQSREVLSVGLANLASGLMGGIPATAALARTALNIKSGATSRASGIINGISILILSTVLFGAFRFLPLPVVAAILVSVAYRMVEWPEISQLYRLDKPLFMIAIVSALTCIAVDPTVGILVGAVLAQIRILMNLRDGHTELFIYKGRTCLMSMMFNRVKAKETVKAVANKYSEEVTEERIRAAGEVDEHALKVLFTSKLAPKENDETETLRTSDGRRGSAADSDLITLAPRKNVDAALPLVAVYNFPGYAAYVSAQIHRDRIRALLMPKAGGGDREGLGEDPKAVAAAAQAVADGVAVEESAAVPKAMPDVKIIAFGLQNTFYLDPDAAETIGTLAEELTRAGYEVYLLGFKRKVFDCVEKVHHLHPVRKFSDVNGLVHFLREQVTEEGKYVKPGPAEHHQHQHSHAAPAKAVAAPTTDEAIVPIKQ